MKTKSKVAAAAKIVEQVPDEIPAGCKHTWLIEPPNGPTSNGSCTVCGEKREFRNSYEYTPSWTARSGKAGAAKAGAAKAAAAAANGANARGEPATNNKSTGRK